MSIALWTVVGVLAVIAGSYLSRRGLLKGRYARDMKCLYREFDFGDSVGFEDFTTAMTVIGESYRVDANKLLPGDSFKELAKSDSWSLDAGAEKLQDFAQKQGRLEGLERVETVRDYILLVFGNPTGSVL